MQSRPRRAPLALLALVLVPPALAGCLRPDLGTTPGAALDGWTGGPRGHVVNAGALPSDSATVTGVAFVAEPTGELRFRAGSERRAPAEHRAIVFHDANVPGKGVGTLIALPVNEVSVDGPVAYTASAATITATEIRHRIREAPTPFRAEPNEALRARLQESGFWSDAAFGARLELRARAGVTLGADRLVLVTPNAVVELGRSTRVEGVESVTTTVPLERVADPTRFLVAIAEERGFLILANASGPVDLDDGARKVSVDGAVALALASGSNVTLIPADADVPGSRPLASVRGRAYQVYSNGRAAIPARLDASIATSSVVVPAGESRAAKFTIGNPDPHTDAAVSEVAVTGAPDDALRMPGFRSITATAFAQVRDDPAAAAVLTAASPALILADAIQLIAEAIAGPPPVPQVLASGASFSSEIGARKPGGPYEATITFTGNFEPRSVTLRVE